MVSLDPPALRSYRNEAGLSQAALASAIGTSTSFVSQLERGVKNPAIDTVRRIAEVLNVAVSAITITVPVTSVRGET